MDFLLYFIIICINISIADLISSIVNEGFVISHLTRDERIGYKILGGILGFMSTLGTVFILFILLLLIVS